MIVVFTLAVTGAAWFLPGRDVIAITVGAFAAWTYVSLIAVVSFFYAFVVAVKSGFDRAGPRPRTRWAPTTTTSTTCWSSP